jgi:hypothetical protein
MENHKDRLGDIFGGVGVAEAAASHAVNPAEMTAHEVGEGGITPLPMHGQKFDVGHRM